MVSLGGGMRSSVSTGGTMAELYTCMEQPSFCLLADKR